MTVSAETTRNDYTGDGTTVTFAYTFRILDQTHLEVYKAGVLQTLTTHYTVSGVGAAGGGNVTFVTAPASGNAVAILRKAPFTQVTDYSEGDKFAAETHEDALDKGAMLSQQLKEEQGRALKFAKTSTLKDIDVPESTSAAARAGKAFRYDGAGTGLEIYTPSTSSELGLITTLGDLVQGGTSGIPERLAAGARGAILRIASTLKAAWLAVGAAGKFLGSDGTDTFWTDVDRVKELGGQVLTLGAIADGQKLVRSGTTIAGAAAGAAPTITTFTGSGTWTKPANLSKVQIKIWGSGAGGGAGASSTGGGGGGGGGYAEKWVAAASLGATETVTVGAGGAAGGAGNSSSFGAHASATGGAAGATGSTSVNAGGTGGVGSSGDLNFKGQGGNFGCGQSGVVSMGGGAGGAAAGGGAGGGEGTSGAGAGITGTAPGGGGSGAPGGGTGAGGAGGAGMVVVIEYF